ncbi:MAG: hypothetical protein A2X30_09635 [Elusimicrobia bacterium GWB2_63_16]|nr:MAG: hypothetical protein A2X30_09635 [Elusimicrobia bacterium GWB2_63_16]
MRILIVDDDAAWVHMLSCYFVGGGHEVLSGRTWAAARSLADHAVPDVILLDASLPDGEAGPFCEAIRSDVRYGRTALLLLSGTEPEAGCGADRFVLKGLPMVELEAAIAAARATRGAAGGGK